MSQQVAKIMSLTQVLRANILRFEIDLMGQDSKTVHLSPRYILADKHLYDLFDTADREKIAYWAGVEQARQQAGYIDSIKKLIVKHGS